MEEIKSILAQWEEIGTANGAGIELSYQLLTLLVAKVEELDAKVNG